MSSGDNNPKQNLGELLRAGGYDNDESDAPYSKNLMEASQPVQRRVKALKKLQLEAITLESNFYERVHALEKDFEPLFNAIAEKRKAIVTGEREPTDAECDQPAFFGLTNDQLQKLENEAPEEKELSKGIPEFWFHCLNNVAQISDTIREYDIPILKYLNDITVEVENDPPGFTLKFYFDENEYFTNTVLRKHYELDLKPDSTEPFDYDGPTIKKSTGDHINWKEGKTVTQKTVKKKTKKGPNAGQFVTKIVTNDSFFNYFDPSEKILSDDLDSEDNAASDFEIGQIIRDQLIPRAVLFYTGEAADEEDDFFEDEEDEDDENEEDTE